MAMQMMDTAYRPDGPLGALFSGMNSASAEEDQKQNLIREFLANQREIQAQPFDQMGKEYDGRLAQAKMNDPNYIPWTLKGQTGQMMSQDAAGRGKQATYENDVALANQTSQNAFANGEMEAKMNALRKIRSEGGSGFTMSPQQQPVAGNGFFGRPQDIEADIASLPEGPDKAGALAQFRQQQQPVAPDPYENQMKLMMDTPKHRQALELQQNKTAAAQAMREQHDQVLLQIAQLRGQGNEKAAKTIEEAMVRSIAARNDLSPTEKEIEYARVNYAKQRARDQGGMGIGYNEDSKQARMYDKPTAPEYKPAPVKTATTMTADDSAALTWANSNPTDPRAKQIKERLGVK
jgi:hypothetical protein